MKNLLKSFVSRNFDVVGGLYQPLDSNIPIVRKIMGISSAYQRGQCLYVGIKLGVFDVFEGKPLSSDSLCDELEIDQDYGFRWFRGLAALGFLEDLGNRKFDITDAGKLLRKDAEIPLYQYISHTRSDSCTKAYLYENIIEMLETGRSTAYFNEHGETTWDTIFKEGNEEFLVSFNEAMRVISTVDAPIIEEVVKTMDFGGCEIVVDIGGGTGMFMNQIISMEGNEKLNAYVLDVENVIDDKKNKCLLEHERLGFIPGNMFVKKLGVEEEENLQILQNADIFFIKNVLLDWYDNDASLILRNILNVAKEGSKVVICENIIPDIITEENGNNIFMDLHFLTVVQGKQRTQKEWRDLLVSSGWNFESIEIGENMFNKGIVIGSKI